MFGAVLFSSKLHDNAVMKNKTRALGMRIFYIWFILIYCCAKKKSHGHVFDSEPRRIEEVRLLMDASCNHFAFV